MLRILMEIICLYSFTYYVVTLVFNVIQFPFALIHRYAVYLLLTFKHYLVSLMFSFVCKNAYNLGCGIALPLIISVIAALIYCGVYSKNNESRSRFILFIILFSVISTILFTFIDVDFCKNIIKWYLDIILKIGEIPVLGKIFNYIYYIGGVLTAFWGVIATALLVAKLFYGNKSRSSKDAA